MQFHDYVPDDDGDGDGLPFADHAQVVYHDPSAGQVRYFTDYPAAFAWLCQQYDRTVRERNALAARVHALESRRGD